MSAVTDARMELVEALAAVLECKVYPNAPKVPTPNCVAITSGTPWMTPDTIGRPGGRPGVRVTWRVLVVVRFGVEYVADLEDIVAAVLGALPEGVTCSGVGPIQTLDTGSGDVQVAEITVTAHITEE